MTHLHSLDMINGDGNVNYFLFQETERQLQGYRLTVSQHELPPIPECH